MNTCSRGLFEALASGGVDGELAPPTVVGLHSQYDVVKRSIASIAAWWFDHGERLEAEIDDGLPRGSRRRIAQGVRQCVAPGAVFSSQGQQFRHRLAPALGSGAAIGRAAVADDRG